MACFLAASRVKWVPSVIGGATSYIQFQGGTGCLGLFSEKVSEDSFDLNLLEIPITQWLEGLLSSSFRHHLCWESLADGAKRRLRLPSLPRETCGISGVPFAGFSCEHGETQCLPWLGIGDVLSGMFLFSGWGVYAGALLVILPHGNLSTETRLNNCLSEGTG